MSECPDCERYKASAALWRNEAYRQAGVPLPWKPAELFDQAWSRGYRAAMEEAAKMCESLQDWPEGATPYDCAASIRSRL